MFLIYNVSYNHSNCLKHDIFMKLEFHSNANFFSVGHINLSSCSLIITKFIKNKSKISPNKGLAMELDCQYKPNNWHAQSSTYCNIVLIDHKINQ